MFFNCKTEQQAQILLYQLRQRFAECGLELHPDKTKIIYCKDGSRKSKYTNTSFDFLGYTFRGRKCKNSKRNTIFINFTPPVSKRAMNAMRRATRKRNVRNRTDLSLNDIARWYNPILQGWLNYYGKYSRSAMYSVLRHFNNTLIAWAVRKYRKFRQRKVWASKYMQRMCKENPKLFAHWRMGVIESCA